MGTRKQINKESDKSNIDFDKKKPSDGNDIEYFVETWLIGRSGGYRTRIEVVPYYIDQTKKLFDTVR